MQTVVSQTNPTENEVVIPAFQGRYQEILRSVGAWLDVRDYRLTCLSE